MSARSSQPGRLPVRSIGVAVVIVLGAIVAFVPRVASSPGTPLEPFAAPPEAFSTPAKQMPRRIAPEAVEVVPHAKLAVHPPASASAASAWASTAATGGPVTARLARTAALRLIVPDVDAAIARLGALAAASGGTIVRLDDRAPDAAGERHTADVTLSVPDDRFEATLARAAARGTLASRTIATEDLSDRLVDAGARLRNLRREERDLRAIMDRSGKVDEILDVERRLAAVRDTIETLDAERAAMTARVERSTLVIALADVATVRTVAPSAGDRLADAWRAALANVESFSIELLARAFVAVAFAPYVLGLAFVATALGRAASRRIRRA